jgi:glycosyltransferase involved in cell wall biosynthesis
MNILFITRGVIPVSKYGGRQRALWWLIKEFSNRGHNIWLMAYEGSSCPYAKILVYDSNRSIYNQDIPEEIDIVHFDRPIKKEFDRFPYVSREGGNGSAGTEYAINTVFVSQQHAHRHGGECFVYNGLDPDEYGDPALERPRKHLHFLAKAAWKLKNVKGSIAFAKQANERLEVIGGHRLNFKMGFRLTFDLNTRFHGIIGGEKKLNLMRGSKGLLFPVLWHEPFGNAMMESMYFGCPVFATPYGVMPEIVSHSGLGYLSKSKSDLVAAIKNADTFNRKLIHEYVMEHFTSKQMADNYLKCYEKVLNGETLNPKRPVVQQGEPKSAFEMTD